jgi:integrase
MRGRALGRGRLVKRQHAGGTIYLGDWTGADGRRRRQVLSADRRAAERKLAEIIRSRDLVIAGLEQEEGLEIPFSELASEYLADVEVRATARSYACRSDSLERFQKSTTVRLVRDVTPHVVEGFLRKRLKQGRAPRTVNNDLLAIKACLNYAVRSGRIALNPVANVRPLPYRGKERRLPRALSEEECIALLKAAVEADGSPAAPRPLLLRALMETGARWSELTSVTWGDLRWLPGELRLRSETTKNRTERVIPLGPTLLGLLRDRAQSVKGLAELPADGLVFTSPWGRPWGLSHNYRDWLDTILERAKIPRKDAQGRVVNVHALRHTFATRLARAGVSLQQAAYLTGHRTLTVLLQIYTHLQAEDARGAITKLSLPTRIPGTKLAHAVRGNEVASDQANVTSSGAGGRVGGPHWIRTSNFHAVNMALCRLS